MRLTFFLTAAILAMSEFAFCQPRVYLPEGKMLDFGDVLNFITKKRTMTIKNSGSETLLVYNVGASCGCTALLLSEDHIAPDDSASLVITLNPSQFNGKIEKLISFNTNDTTESLVEVKFRANVIGLLQIEPQYIFMRGTVGSPVNQKLTIANISGDKIKILSTRSTLEDITVSLSDKVLKPNKAVTLSITYNPKQKGTQNGDIIIETDHPQLGTFGVRIHGFFK